MLPQNLNPLSGRRPSKALPLPLLISGAVLVFLLLVFIGVALTMGGAPIQTETVVELPLE